MGLKDIPKYEKGDALHANTVNTLVDEARKLNRVRTGSGLSARMGRGGLAMDAVFPTIVKIAKVGGSAIPARSSLTLGSGNVTLYDFAHSAIEEGEVDTAYNLSSTAITANAYVMLVDVDGRWVVAWEDCEP
jgi:hypothetical protein